MRKHYERIRRLNELDPATISERGMKLFEEAGELAKEVNRTTGRKKTSLSSNLSIIRNTTLDEAADTIQCVFSVIHQFNEDNPTARPITYADLVEQIDIKNEVWFEDIPRDV